MYLSVESTHVLSLTLFVGTLFLVDLRLLGAAFTQTPVSIVTGGILPWTAVGFVIATVTGFLLFYAIPVRTYHSVWFRVKVICLVLAGLNAWHYHRRQSANRVLWDTHSKPPYHVRLTSLCSILLWISVIFTGRMIAYNWFDCDRPQPDWVIAVAGCVIDEVASQ